MKASWHSKLRYTFGALPRKAAHVMVHFRLFPAQGNHIPAILLAASFAALCLSACLPAIVESPVPWSADAAAPVVDDNALPPAPTGPAARCTVSDGSASFAGRWETYKARTFILPPAARIDVAIESTKGRKAMRFQGFYDQAGQKMTFCPFMAGPPGSRIKCTSLYVLEDDLRAGVRRTFDIPK